MFLPSSMRRTPGGWRLSCECSGRCVDSHFGVDPEGRVCLCGRSADGGTFRFGEAEALGEPFDEEKHDICKEIKAVTYHQTEVRQAPAGWTARVIFDV